jgi:hypothetical protein
MTVQRRANKFQVSKYMVSKPCILKNKHGILAEPTKYIGENTFSEETVLKVKACYNVINQN